MTVMDAILSRRSTRSFQQKPVEQEKLERVLEAGRLAPSARNQQHWKFVVVTDPELREKLAQACCGQAFVAGAPADLVICATQMGMMACDQPAETVDCSIALSFMMLEAAEQGLGTCWLGAFHAGEVKKVLNLPGEDIVVAVSPLGYPDSAVEPRPRKSLEEVVVRM